MAESTDPLQAAVILTLLCGGIGAFIILRKYLTLTPLQIREHSEELSRRSFSAKQFGLLSGILLLLYFLAGCTSVIFFDGSIPVDQKPVVQLLVQWIIYALFAAALVLISRPWNNRFGLTVKNIKWLPIGFGAYFAAIPLIMIISLGYHAVLELITGNELPPQAVAQFVRGDMTWLKAVYILTASIGAPIYEEIFFRGILFPFILKRGGLGTAMAFTALFFAAVHLHIPSLLPIALLSVFLCYAYLRTNSLWACIGIHMMFNTVGIFALNIMGWLAP